MSLMRTSRSKIFVRLFLLAGLLVTSAAAATAQRPSSFQGEWEWAIYAKSRSELPPAYRQEPLRSVPNAAVYLKIRQKGNKLTGEYSASRRYLAKLEDGEFDSVVKGKTTTLELVSGFGGTLTVELTRVGDRLRWRTVKSEGELYFPDDVYLRRIVRRKKQR